MEICVYENYCSWDQHLLWGRDLKEGQMGCNCLNENIILNQKNFELNPHWTKRLWPTSLYEDPWDRGCSVQGCVLGQDEGELQMDRQRVGWRKIPNIFGEWSGLWVCTSASAMLLLSTWRWGICSLLWCCRDSPALLHSISSRHCPFCGCLLCFIVFSPTINNTVQFFSVEKL